MIEDIDRMAGLLRADLYRMFVIPINMIKQVVLIANKRGKEVGNSAKFEDLHDLISTGYKDKQ